MRLTSKGRLLSQRSCSTGSELLNQDLVERVVAHVDAQAGTRRYRQPAVLRGRQGRGQRGVEQLERGEAAMQRDPLGSRQLKGGRNSPRTVEGAGDVGLE